MAAPPLPLAALPHVLPTPPARVSYIQTECRRVAILVTQTPLKDPDLRHLGGFLEWLSTKLPMTPFYAKNTPIKSTLGTLMNPLYGFPDLYASQARALLERWETENWGGKEGEEIVHGADAKRGSLSIPSRRNSVNPTVATTSASVAENQTSSPLSFTAGSSRFRPANRAPPPPSPSPSPSPSPPPPPTSQDLQATARLPQPDHPIFGVNGIMHGVAYYRNRSGGLTYFLDRRYHSRDYKVYGHNGLPVGAWFPRQLSALFHGAHGSGQGGIAGDVALGATSILLTGTYGSLDEDRGDVIFYSGSHASRDSGTTANNDYHNAMLRQSITTRNPVRVLRGAHKESNLFAPPCGIRYDGLYQVVNVALRNRDGGGQFEQFELHRLQGQPPLDSLVGVSPSQQEITDCHRIAGGY